MFNIIRQTRRVLRLGNYVRKGLLANRRFLCTETQSFGPNIPAIANGDQELEHKLKVLVLEVDVMRQEGHMVPDECHLKDTNWEELLKLPTISARRRYLEYLFKMSKAKENRKVRKEERRLEIETLKEQMRQAPEETFGEFVQNHNLGHNTFLLRIFESTIDHFYNNRLVQAMKFGQKLVVDCGFDHKMTDRENKNCAKQLMLTFAENRNHDQPFDLHYCNVNREGVLMETLHKFIGTMHEPWFPLNLHEPSYLDLFPKEQLVYLTPHCREELTVYDHDTIYIIGGIVDKVHNQPLSLAKAKREGLRMAKFPLDRYLQWGAGSGKSLTLNQVTSILLDVKSTGDWKFALRHVPKRKVVEFSPQPSKTTPRNVWTPASKIDLGNLSFNPEKNTKKKERERLIKVRTIMTD